MQNNNIGNKIRFFRQRAKLSQMQLETAIGASTGMISRIENNQVNPSKETVLHISEALGLNYKEIDYMIGQTARPATDLEVQLALKEVEDYFSKNVFAYLIDERWSLLKVSRQLLKALKLDDDYIEQFRGRCTIEFLTNPELQIIDRFCPEKMESMLENNLLYFYKETGFMQDEEFFKRAQEGIKTNPIAAKIWEKVLENGDELQYPIREGRVIHFKVGGISVPFTYHYEPLLRSSRFQIVVWTPVHKFVNVLSKILV